MSANMPVNSNTSLVNKFRVKKVRGTLIAYIILCILAVIMVYPLLWLFMGSFKSNSDLFTSANLIPKQFMLDSYAKGWKGIGKNTYGLFFLNTFILVIPTVLLTVTSSALVAYGFTRFKFPLQKILFSLMIATLMLPHTVIIIPRYILFRNFHWLNSYLPFIVPAALACYPFFVFMMIQFFRGLPKELDESAMIDGCNPFAILVKILVPLAKPALISAAIFQFIWTWNDFFNSLIFINSVKKYTISLALRIAIDSTGGLTNWNEVLAMSVLAVLPPVLIFFFAQKYFVEGIATTGLKG